MHIYTFYFLPQVRSMSHFFNWTKNTMVEGLRADVWYNGQPPIGQRGFIGDRNSRIMGWALMRQLRVKQGNFGISICLIGIILLLSVPG